MKSKNKIWRKVKKIRAELEKSPNGWPLCKMVGSEYFENRAPKSWTDA
tara:strand:+ start:275 stop:418 length:144 start_codon:yes stop_codon:yes gene_type:complete